MSLSNLYPSLHGQVVFITGGATGIGSCLVESFALQGAKVVFVDVLVNESIELVTTLKEQNTNPEVYFYECDLTNIDKLKQIMEEVEEKISIVENVSEKISALKEKLESLQESKENIESSLSEIKQSFEAIKNSKDTISNEFSDLGQKLEF